MQGDEGVRIPLLEANRELPGGQAVLERFKDLFLTRQSAAPRDLGGVDPSRAGTDADVTDAPPGDGAASVAEPDVARGAQADRDEAEVAVAPPNTDVADAGADTDAAGAGVFDDEPASETPEATSTAEDEALLAAAGTFDTDDDDTLGDQGSTAKMDDDAPAEPSEEAKDDDDLGASGGATTIMPAFDPASLESDDEPEPDMESTRMMAAVDPVVFETPTASAEPTSGDDESNRRGGRRNKRGRRSKK